MRISRSITMPLALLAIAGLGLLSCDGTPTELDQQGYSDQADFAANKPLVGLTVECWGCFLVDGNEYYTDETTADLFYDVCPAGKGQIRVYGCQDDTGTLAPASFCNDGTYRWIEEKRFRIKRVYPEECWNPLFNTTGTTTGEGWLVRYQAQGSGYSNEEYAFTVYFVPSNP